MPWIEQIDETRAEQDLKELYEEIQSTRGKVSNVMRVHSLLPQTMRAHLRLYTLLMFETVTSLSRAERELVAVTVSSENNCEYCVRHHLEALKTFWKDEQKLKSVLERKWTLLSEREKALVDYALQLTRAPAETTPHHLESLRKAGLSDRDILHLNLVVAYFNFVNRLVLGLGVEFTEDEIKGYKY